MVLCLSSPTVIGPRPFNHACVFTTECKHVVNRVYRVPVGSIKADMQRGGRQTLGLGDSARLIRAAVPLDLVTARTRRPLPLGYRARYRISSHLWSSMRTCHAFEEIPVPISLVPIKQNSTTKSNLRDRWGLERRWNWFRLARGSTTEPATPEEYANIYRIVTNSLSPGSHEINIRD